MGTLKRAGNAPQPSPDQRLDSWKEISAYLKRTVRTVQRWERTQGLPVHRIAHDKRSTVFAYRSELDQWWAGRQQPAQGNPVIGENGRRRGAYLFVVICATVVVVLMLVRLFGGP